MSRPESVSSRMASLGSSTAIWRISLRFFSPPEKPELTARLMISGSHSTSLSFSSSRSRKSIESSSSSPARLPDLVVGRAEEVGVGDAGDLDRVLEGEEHARLGPLLGLQVEQVLPAVEHRAAGHLVGRVAGQHLGQRALARAVRAHDGVHLAGVDREVDALEDLLVAGARAQVSDFQHCRSSPVSASIRRCLRG